MLKMVHREDLLKSTQNLLGKGKITFEGKAFSWEVLLLSATVQVGKKQGGEAEKARNLMFGADLPLDH